MARKSLLRLLSVLGIALFVGIFANANASEIDNNFIADSDISANESVESQEFAEISSRYQVTIPKTIILSGETKSATYTISVNGNIVEYETIKVEPDEFVVLSSPNKSELQAVVEQDKKQWTKSTQDVSANGLISVEGLTAGHWNGTLNFHISVDKVRGDIISPYHVHTQTAQTSENVIEATCESAGSYDEVFYCPVCDSSIRNTITMAPLGHKESEVITENLVEATCTEPGSYDEVIYCTVCEQELSRESKETEALGHDFVDGYCTKCNEPEIHVHSGSPETGGGCYTVPVYHTHDGNEQSGGACYEVYTDADYDDVTSYKLKCTKTPGVDIDYYELGCGQ